MVDVSHCLYFICTLLVDTLCAGSGSDSRACQGDSGGPLSCLSSDGLWQLVGITSWGSNKCTVENAKPTVFTDISKYYDWIKVQIDNSITCSG